MEKIICNVLYEAKLPIDYKEHGLYNHNIGMFENSNDAVITARIVKKVLLGQKNLVSSVGDCEVVKVLVPENENKKYYSSVKQACANNIHVRNFINLKGKDCLQTLINEVISNNELLQR